MTWRQPLQWLAFMTAVFLVVTYLSILRIPDSLSPQACRMSYMTPSYVLQANFDSSWTRLARRYSLWLYREDPWEDHHKLTGLPVLFIPGNAGSSRQVRSIASSATRQYYSEPYKPNVEFTNAGLKPLDFFSVDFNEDFSALHGPTLFAEREYASAAIEFILSRYESNTSIIVMGHSMGGIVALSLLPSRHISAIITMSTPHSLPPARIDERIEEMYDRCWGALRNDSTTILSICGGATDLMIPSETCSMQHRLGPSSVRKRTVFTTCLEGAWTGVGHREMVWCHQIRWRVARAAIELANAYSDSLRTTVLDHWFRDGLILDRPGSYDLLLRGSFEKIELPKHQRLFLSHMPLQPTLYLIPVTSSQFTLFVSRGRLHAVSPQHPADLEAAVYRCQITYEDCQLLPADELQLIPDSSKGSHFQLPHEGVDESEGVARYKVTLGSRSDVTDWIGVAVRGPGNHKSWIVGGFDDENLVELGDGVIAPFLGSIPAILPTSALSTRVAFPNVLSSSLIVYRIQDANLVGACSAALLPPLILHRSKSFESHFHLSETRRDILIHTHSSGPFIPSEREQLRGIILDVYSSGECGVSSFKLTVDWKATLSTWGLRYWTTVIAWSMGVVMIMIGQCWHEWENGDPFPPLPVSLYKFISRKLLPLTGILITLSCLPLNANFFLGNSGEIILSPLAAVMLFVSGGCVTISCIVLEVSIWITRRVSSLSKRGAQTTRLRRRDLWSLGLILLLVATIIPSQVAFLVCFLIHLATCIAQTSTSVSDSSVTLSKNNDILAQQAHFLLMLFWLLPSTAPVLGVWARTLLTAGLTTPFDGDHNVFTIASFLLYTNLAASDGTTFDKATSRLEKLLTIGLLYAVAAVAFVVGGRYAYWIYTTCNIAMWYLLASRIGKKYLLFTERLQQ